MVEYKLNFEQSSRNKEECNAVSAETVYVNGHPYLAICMASASAPLGIAEAVANTMIVRFRDYACKEENYTIDALAERKKKLTEILSGIHDDLQKRNKLLDIKGLLSVTMLFADEDGNVQFVQVGANAAIIIAAEKAAVAAEPQIADESGLFLTQAIGMDTAIIKPHFTKTILSRTATIYLLSAGFSKFRQQAIRASISKDGDIRATSLIRLAMDKRTLASSDAVLAVHAAPM